MTTTFKLSSKQLWDDINSSFGSNGGIYILFSKDENEKIKPINRLLRTDESGTLYIGRANCFTNRVIELKKSLSPEHQTKSHECGARMKALRLIQHFNYENLFINLIESSDVKELELTKLSEYEAKFGELPPLNRMK